MGELVRLYLLFLRIGAVTFGGGLAMLPLLQKEVIDRRGWVTEEELNEYYAVGMCTPGVIALNVSTFIGMKRKGVIGGIVSTAGFITAPLITIVLLAGGLMRYTNSPGAAGAMNAIRAFVCVIVAEAVVKFWKKGIRTSFSLVIAAAAVLSKLLLPAAGIPVNSYVVVISAGVIGILHYQKSKKL